MFDLTTRSIKITPASSKLFNVLTRVKVLKERKALLELPREQRRLIMDKGEEVEDLPLPKTIM